MKFTNSKVKCCPRKESPLPQFVHSCGIIMETILTKPSGLETKPH
jgi:hypothetical protein